MSARARVYAALAGVERASFEMRCGSQDTAFAELVTVADRFQGAIAALPLGVPQMRTYDRRELAMMIDQCITVISYWRGNPVRAEGLMERYTGLRLSLIADGVTSSA